MNSVVTYDVSTGAVVSYNQSQGIYGVVVSLVPWNNSVYAGTWQYSAPACTYPLPRLLPLRLEK